MTAPLLEILNKPFPELESSYGLLKITAIISLFVTFFLYVFEPFGISTIESNKFLICLGFGSMTCIATLLFEFLVGPVLKLKGGLKPWTFGKWILSMLGVILAISFANFLFARIVIFGYIDWELLPVMMYSTFMIGLIPVAVLGWASLLIQEKKYQSIADKLNQERTSHASNEIAGEYALFDIPLSQIRYVEALQNYVNIAYVNSEGQFKKMTERATLKNILEEISGSSLVKSHRSFLVNRKAIISISGNAQGLLLELSDCDRTIPVSRSFVAAFRGD